jgi:hypothetical protein
LCHNLLYFTVKNSRACLQVKEDLKPLLAVSESKKLKESGSLFAEYKELYMVSQIEESL